MSGRVTVGGANEPPVIAVERETPELREGALIVFRVLAEDPERIPLRITWDLDGDGQIDAQPTGVSVGARYRPGVHTVLARATDDLGLIAESRYTFTIPGASEPLLAPAAPPVGSAPDQVTPPASHVRASRSIRLAALRRHGLRVVVTPGVSGRVLAELRGTGGRRLARAVATGRMGAALAIRLRAPRARAGRLRLVVTTADARSIRRDLRVRR